MSGTLVSCYTKYFVGIPISQDSLSENLQCDESRLNQSTHYRSEDKRLESFRTWPYGHLWPPQDMAKAGFYYLQEGDKVQCAFCNGTVGKWEPGDDPLMEHKRHFPNCPFILMHFLVNMSVRRDTCGSTAPCAIQLQSGSSSSPVSTESLAHKDSLPSGDSAGYSKSFSVSSEIVKPQKEAVAKNECQPFLQRFQTSKPMTPYLFEAVEKLLRYLMNRCVKPDLMKCTGPKLLSIDTKKSENLILSKNIDIGFATKRLLGETAITVTERQKLEFIHECRSMLTTMIAKLQEKSPLKQKAVRGLSSLDPCVIQHSPQLAQKRFSFLLEELNHANIINDVLAENAKKEYLHFCNLKKSELQEIFRPCDQFSDEVGLDTIYGSFLIGEANYKHLWEVIKICLVLSHGNATVEGGFSVNKSLLVENMHEKTVIAQRHIHDEIQEAGGIKNIHISKKMLDYVRGARKRYHEYLEMKKQEKSEKDKKKAEKRKLDIQVKDLEGERKKLMMATEEKREAIDVELQELKKKQASLY
uniref:Uncharacterized protein n=1 Tax=Timema cristinae TaxID=61476 RepID=A0A7R9CPW5_TIMCR|nr:unnamed protein product [Timema cristinae]